MKVTRQVNFKCCNAIGVSMARTRENQPCFYRLSWGSSCFSSRFSIGISLSNLSVPTQSIVNFHPIRSCQSVSGLSHFALASHAMRFHRPFFTFMCSNVPLIATLLRSYHLLALTILLLLNNEIDIIIGLFD